MPMLMDGTPGFTEACTSHQHHLSSALLSPVSLLGSASTCAASGRPSPLPLLPAIPSCAAEIEFNAPHFATFDNALDM